MMIEAGTYDNRAYLTVLLVRLSVVVPSFKGYVCMIYRLLSDSFSVHYIHMFNDQETDLPFSYKSGRL